MKEIETKEILIDDIDAPAFHDRSYIDRDGIVSLAKSIKDTGMMIEPIVVRMIDGRYERLAGYRRLEAVKLLGWDSIAAKIVECEDDEALLVMIMENTEREELNAYDRIRSILQYLSLRMDMNENELRSLVYRIRNASIGNTKKDKSLKELQQRMEGILVVFGMKVSSFSNYLSVLMFDEEIVAAMRKYNLSFSLTQHINKTREDKPFMRTLLSLAIDGELTVKDAAQKVKEWERGRLDNTGDKSEIILSRARMLLRKDRLSSLSSTTLEKIEEVLAMIEEELQSKEAAAC